MCVLYILQYYQYSTTTTTATTTSTVLVQLGSGLFVDVHSGAKSPGGRQRDGVVRSVLLDYTVTTIVQKSYTVVSYI